jgi:hypothetical protein
MPRYIRKKLLWTLVACQVEEDEDDEAGCGRRGHLDHHNQERSSPMALIFYCCDDEELIELVVPCKAK